jgi:hypothetical protein
MNTVCRRLMRMSALVNSSGFQCAPCKHKQTIKIVLLSQVDEKQFGAQQVS